MKNCKVCDEQLILCYRQNSKEAYDMLLHRKHSSSLPLLKKYVAQCRPYGSDMNDIYAVFLESFHKAIKRFSFEYITFQTYFLKVLNRDLAGFCRYVSNPNNPANNSISLDAEVSYDSTMTFHDVLTDQSQKVNARNFVNIAAVHALIASKAHSVREETTLRIIMLKAVGYSIPEIAKILCLKPASIRRRLNNFETGEIGEQIKKCLI
ncbi:MAG: helix-turn-helix domain-containing protein [Bacteroidia bacterium]|nr:helix-turn-helix domain-containing protein [Bacteroidia bacterium]